MAANPVKERRHLLYLLSIPNAPTLNVRVAIVGQVEVVAQNPADPEDRIVVLLKGPDANRVRQYDLLGYAPVSWWRRSPNLMNAVTKGWLFVDLPPVIVVPPPEPAPIPPPPPVLCAPYTPGQATNIYAGSITVTVQADVDLLIGYDGMVGDLDLSATNGAIGLDWSPLAGLKEIDGILTVDTYHVSDLPPFPALKYVSSHTLISTNQYLNVETELPATYMAPLARVDGQLSLNIATLSPVFSVDGLFPLLHTIGTKFALQFDYSPVDMASALSAVGICPCLETASVTLNTSDNGFVTTLDIQGAFPNLIASSPLASGGVEIGTFNVVDSTGAFPVLALVYRRLGLRPFPYGCTAPPIYPSLTTIDGRIDIGQGAIGVDFSACLPVLQVCGAILMQQSDGCVFPLFPALTSIVPSAIAPTGSLSFTDNINTTLPTFPVLATTNGGVSVNSNAQVAPAFGLAFPSLTRIGPVGGPYRDFSFQQNTDVFFAVSPFPSLLFVDDVNISDNIGPLSLEDAFVAVTTANNITIDTNDISANDNLFTALTSVSTLIFNNNTGAFSLAAVDGVFVSLTTALKIHFISNPGLLSAVSAFPALVTVTGGALVGDLIITDCANLSDATGAFPVLVSAGDHVAISNSIFTTLTNVAPLLTTAGRIGIEGNTNLLSIVDCFPMLVTTTVSAVRVDGNPALVLIDGSFISLATAQGLIMEDNGAVVFTNGTFDVLGSVVIDCILSGGIGNAGFALGTLNSAFPVLTTVGALTINNLPFVTSLATAFPSLSAFTIDLRIQDNLLLNDISGLLTLNGALCGATPTAPVFITNNVSLSTAGQISPLTSNLVGEGWLGLPGSVVFGNAP